MTPDLRRMASLVAAGLITLAALILFGWTLSGWFNVQNDIEEAIAAQAVPPAADPARYLTQGASHGDAGSNLQTRINQAARSVNLTPSRVQISQPDAADPLALRLEFQAEGRLDALAELVHTLETDLPALVITDVQISPVRRSENLQMTATVSARREPGGNE